MKYNVTFESNPIKFCLWCPMALRIHDNIGKITHLKCVAKNLDNIDLNDERPKDCPLVEVE